MPGSPLVQLSHLFAGLLVLALVFAVRVDPAHACSCALIPVADMVDDGDAAFVGIYTGRTESEPHGPMVSSASPVINHFQVEAVIKGSLGPTVDVHAAREGASCGLEVAAGERIGLVLSAGNDGSWTSNLCRTADPDAMLALAGSGEPAPAPPAPVISEPGPPTSPSPAASPAASEEPEPEAPSSQIPEPAPSDELVAVSGGGGSPAVPVIVGLLLAGLGLTVFMAVKIIRSSRSA